MLNTPDKVLILSDSQALIDTIELLLEDTIKHLQTFVHYKAEVAAKAFRQQQVDVVVLAYQDLQVAISVRDAIARLHQPNDKPFHAIVLCKKDTVVKAYELSRKRFFYDYVVFWPLGYDPYRLIMSIHQAIDDLGYNADIQMQRLELESRRQRIQAVSRLVEQLLTDQKAKKAELETMIRVALKKLTMPVRLDQSSTQEQLTVLVIDDDEFQCMVLKKILEEAGFKVQLATSGEQGLGYLEKSKVDIVLLDVMMPGLSGIDTLRQLKNDPELSDIPVIMVSGHHEKEVVLDCIMLGAINYIVKPVSKEVLLSHLPSHH